MRTRFRWALVIAVILAGIAGTPVHGVAAMASVTASVALLVWVVGGWPGTHTRLPVVTCAAAVISLAVTLSLVTGVEAARGEDVWGLVESAALIALTSLTARWSPVRQAVPSCVLAGTAASTWLLRYFAPASPLEALGACAFWSVVVLGAVGVGLYLRSLDTRRTGAVAASRAAQRLQLARDLHDYVAHDVSEMLAHAQAGQVVGVGDLGQALLALQRVEHAGLRAMATLDRTVLQLHEEPATTPDLADLPKLADRFSSAGKARVRLGVDDGLDVPREAEATAYRIVVEALNNVRRHAPDAVIVDIVIRADGDVLVVTVDNDGVTDASSGSGRGGFGLRALSEHVESLGGELAATAVPGGWSLMARFPLTRWATCPPASSSPTTRKASAVPSG